MAQQFNPFHQWLGFDENLTQPNHFELFGVKPNSDDPIGFRKQIHAQAKSMLSRLEKMSDQEIGERRKLHTRLRRHIVKAHEILLDDKLRAAYLKGLRQKAREDKGSAKPLAVPPPRKSAADAQSQSQSRAQSHSQAASQTGKHSGMTIKRSGGTPTIKQKSDVPPGAGSDVGSGIPMAIPLSRPGAEPSDDAEARALSTEVDLEQSGSAEISIKPARVKRKRSWLIPIAMIVMTLFCVAGIGALVKRFGLNVDWEDSATTTANVDESSEAAREQPVVAPTTEEIAASTEDLVKSLPDELESEEMTSPDDAQPSAATETPDSGNAEVNHEVAMPAKEEADSQPTESRITLSPAQLHTVRFLFQRAGREMKRGRLESAGEQYRLAESLFADQKLEAGQSAIPGQIKNGRAMIEHLKGFWQQVADSSQKITGGELEPQPGVVIGFVEGRQDDVVLRFGENVQIPYRSLRPGLAMLLATKKGAKNVPAWRLSEAAFRLVHTEDFDPAEAKIEDLVAASEADGYDGSAIREFEGWGLGDWRSANMNAADSNLTTEGLFPDPTMTAVAKDALAELGQQLTEGKYQKLNGLKPDVASRLATELLSASYDDPSLRIAALNESIKLNRQAGDAFAMVDAIDELDRWTEIDGAKQKLDGFVRIATRPPQGASVRGIGEAFYEFLGSPDASAVESRRLTRLKERMVKLVASHGLDDLRRLILQTMD